MMKRLLRWAREGSIATVAVCTMASAPTAAQAGWFDDVKDATAGIAGLLNPSHDIGKFALGTVMMGGGAAVWASSGMALGAAAIVGTALTAGGILLIVGGAGLAIWGGYKIWKSFQDDGSDRTPTAPGRPGSGAGDPGRPGRIEPGGETPGTSTNPGTPGTPGSGTPGSGTGTFPGGTSTSPGNNHARPGATVPGIRPRPVPGTNVGGASGAGMGPNSVLPR